MKAFERIKTMTINEKALELHEKWNGKLDTVSKVQVKTREDLALAYTPGVAEPCKVIAEDPEAAYRYTIKSNTVAVVSDGSAVLGLGNIGPLAAMPVMEGKSSAASMHSRSASTHRTPRRSSRQLSALPRHSAVSTWRTSPRRAALRSKNV